MKTSPEGLRFIKRHEGCRLEVYEDVTGHATIGYGHLVTSLDKLTKISQSDADALLASDLKRFEAVVSQLQSERAAHGRARLAQHQLDALVDFAFNVGRRAFTTSRVYYHAANDHTEAPHAPAAMMTWTKSNGVRLTGLMRRRYRCYKLYMEADYQ